MINRLVALGIFMMIAYTNCSQTGFSTMGTVTSSTLASTASSGTTVVTTPSGTGTTTTPAVAAGNNIVPVSVSGVMGNFDQPLVSVTICVPGTNTCNTIPNVLLDTGSVGLRLYHDNVNINLSTITDNSGYPLATCQQYLGAANQWGRVVRADVVLGGETASSVPVEIIDSTYANVPSSCGDPSVLAGSYYNGIMGVGMTAPDCGTACTTQGYGLYFACPSYGNCVDTKGVAVTSQVANPVSYMPTDNNGIILVLPAIPADGSISITGSMIMGIGTQANNTITPAHVFAANSELNFSTLYNGKTDTNAFIDSGSNALYFDANGDSSLPTCSGSGLTDFFCPSTDVTKTAYQIGYGSSAQVATPFTIQNTETALNGNNWAINIGGPYSGYFDWGLPFFFGKSVVVGIQGRASSLGTGPYWAW